MSEQEKKWYEALKKLPKGAQDLALARMEGMLEMKEYIESEKEEKKGA